MNWLDYTIVVFFLLAIAVIGSLFTRRASQSTDEFIVAGRKLPWWLAGVAMVALGFNADSPMHTSKKIRTTGIQGAWFYWNSLLAGSIGTLLFAPMIRRTRISTPSEFYSLRYHGAGQHMVRVGSAFLIGIFNGVIFGALGLIGMIKLSRVLFDFPEVIMIAGLPVHTPYLVAGSMVLLALGYSIASGLWGVVWTDMLEYAVALGCSFLLTGIVLSKVGGGSGLREQIGALNQGNLFRWLPEIGIPFVAYIFIIPFLRLGAVDFSTQRLLSIKDEREVVLANFFNNLNFFVFRNWPWFVVGLASILLITPAEIAALTGTPGADVEYAYPAMVAKYMPHGLLGLMIAGFFCAFLSSIDAILHTGASIFVNDMYRPYMVRNASDKHYIFVTRIMMVVVAAMSIYLAANSPSILSLLAFLNLVLGSVGLVQMGRWIWWRVNVWSDLAGHVSAVVLGFYFGIGPGTKVIDKIVQWAGNDGFDTRFTTQLLLCVSISTLVSLVVMLLTPPEPNEKLVSFYRLMRPFGWWGPIAAQCPEVPNSNQNLPRLMILSIYGIFAAIGLTFGAGMLILAQPLSGSIMTTIGIACSVLLIRGVNNTFSRGDTEDAIPAVQALKPELVSSDQA